MIFKVIVITSGGHINVVDGVEYDDRLWLVPKWLYSHSLSVLSPDIMIRFDNLSFHKQDCSERAYILREVIPASLLDGHISEQYEILQGTDTTVSIPTPVLPQ